VRRSLNGRIAARDHLSLEGGGNGGSDVDSTVEKGSTTTGSGRRRLGLCEGGISALGRGWEGATGTSGEEGWA
jgi:hypothetical protein